MLIRFTLLCKRISHLAKVKPYTNWTITHFPSSFRTCVTKKSPSRCGGPQFVCWDLPSAFSQAVYSFISAFISSLCWASTLTRSECLGLLRSFLSKHTSLGVCTILWKHMAFKNPRSMWELFSVCYRHLIPHVFLVSQFLPNYYVLLLAVVMFQQLLLIVFTKCPWGLFVLNECWVRSNIYGLASGVFQGINKQLTW